MPRKKNLFAKSATKGNPHAIYQHQDWTWYVIKTWKHADNEPSDPYARWYCFVTSSMCPKGEYGDVYIRDILEVARAKLVEASPEWLKVYNVKLGDDKKSWFNSHVEVIGVGTKPGFEKAMKQKLLNDLI